MEDETRRSLDKELDQAMKATRAEAAAEKGTKAKKKPAASARQATGPAASGSADTDAAASSLKSIAAALAKQRALDKGKGSKLPVEHEADDEGTEEGKSDTPDLPNTPNGKKKQAKSKAKGTPKGKAKSKAKAKSSAKKKPATKDTDGEEKPKARSPVNVLCLAFNISPCSLLMLACKAPDTMMEAYHAFLKTKIAELKEQNPDMDKKQALSWARNAWKNCDFRKKKIEQMSESEKSKRRMK